MHVYDAGSEKQIFLRESGRVRSTPRLLYFTIAMSFGLCNSPIVFQRLVNLTFRDLKRIVLAYTDDLIIPCSSNNAEKDIEKLRRMLGL